MDTRPQNWENHRKRETLDYFRSKGLLERVRELLKDFFAVKKNLLLYPPHHEICLDSVSRFMSSFREYLRYGESLSLRIVGEEFFFEERLLARESVLYYPLLQELRSKGVGGVNFLAGLEAGELVDFLRLLNLGEEEIASRGGLAKLLEDNGITHVILDPPGTWEEKISRVREAESAREEYFEAVDVIRELSEQVLHDRRLSVSKANRVVGMMLNRVGENRSAVLGLATLKSYDEYTTFHSVNVLILSLALASMLPLDRNALMILGTGALLHDLGKVTIPKSILGKRGPLTAAEWEEMKRHPVRGADILLAQPGVHPLSVLVAYEHHARYDLSGYPKLNGVERPSLFSRIVQLADVYDAMTTVRPYQDARTPDHAIRVLVKEKGTAFDPLLVKVFVDMMGLYPVGTLVRLCTGELGVVYEQVEGDATSPRVKIIRDPEEREVEPHIVEVARLREKASPDEEVISSVRPEQVGLDPLDYLD
ncbi:HD-GYP domain-containing protein [Candidatus Solincola tengchongensis]|uniref:HD-GYP domain-containing protein n=1 Tax=Candidatus Solincola tengchongensis TaxID=2900693 RepID=UPI00257C3954|nr:HD-GYP domain-containing protein [Candidatus Solincola tengchongensis]